MVIVIVAVIALVAVAAVVLIGVGKVDQVRVTVQSAGSWSGAYGDQGGLNTWSGTGTRSVVVDRPANTPEWNFVANAVAISGTGGYVTVTIASMDGKVLAQKTSSGMFSMATASVNL